MIYIFLIVDNTGSLEINIIKLLIRIFKLFSLAHLCISLRMIIPAPFLNLKRGGRTINLVSNTLWFDIVIDLKLIYYTVLWYAFSFAYKADQRDVFCLILRLVDSLLSGSFLWIFNVQLGKPHTAWPVELFYFVRLSRSRRHTLFCSGSQPFNATPRGRYRTKHVRYSLKTPWQEERNKLPEGRKLEHYNTF